MAEPDLIARLALEWLKADRESRKEHPPKTNDVELSVAADRVYQVLAGNIRWDDATPGDRAIWRGRFRDVERFDAWWRSRLHEQLADQQPVLESPLEPDPYNQTAPAAPRRPVARQPKQVRRKHQRRMYCNYYDTVQVTPAWFDGGVVEGFGGSVVRYGVRMFGENIGNFSLTNMAISHQVPNDTMFYVETMYARADNVHALAMTSRVIFATLRLADTAYTDALPIGELVMGVPVRHLIPIRARFWVDLARVDSSVWRDLGRDYPQGYQLSVHLEGVRIWP